MRSGLIRWHGAVRQECDLFSPGICMRFDLKSEGMLPGIQILGIPRPEHGCFRSPFDAPGAKIDRTKVRATRWINLNSHVRIINIQPRWRNYLEADLITHVKNVIG